jgi:hypothetical protein
MCHKVYGFMNEKAVAARECFQSVLTKVKNTRRNGWRGCVKVWSEVCRLIPIQRAGNTHEHFKKYSKHPATTIPRRVYSYLCGSLLLLLFFIQLLVKTTDRWKPPNCFEK